MKKLKLLVFFVISIGVFSSCQKEEIINENPQEAVIKPTKAQLEKLSKMNINTDNVAIKDITFLDGTNEKHLVSQDILISLADLNSYTTAEPNPGDEKQFRFPNIVAPPFRNIRILGYTGGSFALTNKMQTALGWAVFNYNVLPNTINLNLAFGTNIAAADIIVYKVNGGLGGAASIPTPAGQPGKFVMINSGTDAFNINVNEHVIGHEIGHALGLAHQDWSNPCGGGPVPGVGPIWIPGTPFSPFAPSIMRSCINPGTDGELTATDKDALNILY